MAEKWQQWMPFHIDRWRGSPDVRAMHPAARMGYLELLCSCWQSADCSVPNDAVDLATASGMGDDLWALYGNRILRKFTLAGDRYSNTVLKVEWDEARDKFEHNREARRIAGQLGNAKRWGRNCDEKDRKRVANASQNIATVTETLTTTTKPKQKPSRGKRELDTRHTPFRLACHAYAVHKRVTFVWDGSEAKQLDLLLAAAPDLTLARFQTCLQHRGRSPAVVHSDRPRLWLSNVLRYEHSPLNQFNQPEGTGNGNAKGKSGQTVDAAREAAKLIARDLGFDENGNPPAGPEIVAGGLPCVRGGSRELSAG